MPVKVPQKAKREPKHEKRGVDLKKEVKEEVKREVKREAVKADIKRELVKSEVKREAVKVEVKREGAVKSEVKKEAVKAEPSDVVAALLQRGLAMRREVQQVKEEQGLKGKLKKVKLEKVKRKRKGGGRKKGSAKKRMASREVMSREVPLSPPLAALLGAPALSRPEAVKRLWGHCREQGMLNQADKREILFNDELKQMFSRDKARMCDLISMLMPHFDYAAQAAGGGSAKTQPKQEEPCPVKRLLKGEAIAVKRPVKGESVIVKRPVKGECIVVKRPLKSERLAERLAVKRHFKETEEAPGRPPAKREPTAGAVEVLESGVAIAAKREGLSIHVKDECVAPRTSNSNVDLREVAQRLTPQLRRIGPDSVAVECRLEEGTVAAAADFRVRASARRPSAENESEQAPLVANGVVDFREASDGCFVPFLEATLSGLDPGLSYRINVEVVQAAGSGSAPALSPEVVLPQRASPARWSASEAQQWCNSLGIPVLTQKAREYGFNGATLFALSEQDLHGLGLCEPPVMRRFLAGIRDLKASGA